MNPHVRVFLQVHLCIHFPTPEFLDFALFGKAILLARNSVLAQEVSFHSPPKPAKSPKGDLLWVPSVIQQNDAANNFAQRRAPRLRPQAQPVPAGIHKNSLSKERAGISQEEQLLLRGESPLLDGL